MRAVVAKALADVRRRRLQAAVIFITTLLAAGAGTMALMIVSQTSDPYMTAFQDQRGAHLQVYFDPKTDPALLAQTPSLIGAVAYGGPYRATEMQFQAGGHKYAVTTIGRDDPNGSVEQLRITSGSWPSDETGIVLTRSFADLNHISIGDRLKVVSVPQEPMLTVVAEVVDIDEPQASISGQHAWVLDSAFASLAATGSTHYLMDYRFAGEPTAAQLTAHMDAMRASLPPASITRSVDYLLVGSIFNITNQVLVGILVAFSVFALAATAAIVANLVTGIVIASYREIGIMKAVGFAPSQVVGVFVLQVIVPAAAGCAVGIPAGSVLSQPILASSSEGLGLAYQPSFSFGIGLVALAGVLLTVTAAALLPSLRAGLLKPSIVITNASAPRGRSGRWLRSVAALGRLPRPVALGLGEAVARPVRALLTLIAIFVGVATVVVALGETRAFSGIYTYEAHIGNVDVVVNRSPALADADAIGLITSQPETARVVGQTDTHIAVPGIADPVYTAVFRGESSRLGYLLVSGHWFSGPGEVVAPIGLLRDAHLKLDDTFIGTLQGASLKLRIVGEVYDFQGGPGGHEMITDWSTIASFASGLLPSTYLITLRPGANVGSYVRRLAQAEPDLLDVQANQISGAPTGPAISAVLFAIAAVLVLIALAGIFNTLLLNTRERMRDTATLKALGMSPRQVIAMVASSAGFLALAGGLVGVPGGVALSRLLFDLVGGLGGANIPPAAYGAYSAWELAVILLAGVVVAVVASVIPGRWAARTNVIEVLHAE
ncbi:MAG TPA: FtsX-like permease family protein [Candidatus Dormibacteraeota bacterium]|nr:FtsX-like permease family protein [Candidatus Dormibacteraeota bacterium]